MNDDGAVSEFQDDRLKSLADKTSGVGKFQQVVMEECIVLGSNVPVGESLAVYNDIGDVLNKVGDIVHVEGVQDSVQVGDGSWRQQSVVSSGHSVEDSTQVGSHEGERMAREARRNAGDIGMNKGGSSVESRILLAGGHTAFATKEEADVEVLEM
ncbi:hypothetical protein LWI29_016120 [Acer saccharum]|uniref:Uncharacterized protein n=1 Tax=Acer saccharum TaxID=4024 RepID=A0AA39RWQ2_ACESA|nr:hypothetical protein LWI29_016120 [Acer saccharum]